VAAGAKIAPAPTHQRSEETLNLLLNVAAEKQQMTVEDNAGPAVSARYDLVHRSASHEDFDMASAGLVKVFEGAAASATPTCRGSPKPHSPR
jgi:hypothetical protein